eukprot:9478453-Pyramimonas_sp.AAC.1
MEVEDEEEKDARRRTEDGGRQKGKAEGIVGGCVTLSSLALSFAQPCPGVPGGARPPIILSMLLSSLHRYLGHLGHPWSSPHPLSHRHIPSEPLSLRASFSTAARGVAAPSREWPCGALCGIA